MEASERPTEGKVAEGHPSWYQETEETTLIEPRLSAVRAFRKHISGGAVVAGTLVALALQVMFIAFGGFLGVGAASVASLAGLSTMVTSVGIWVAVSASVAAFIGAYIAARVANTTMATRNGMWHGLITWGLLIISGLVLGMFGFAGVLGFGISGTSLISAYVPNVAALSAANVATAGSIATTMSGWFLAGAIGSLVLAVFGGYLGGMALRR